MKFLLPTLPGSMPTSVFFTFSLNPHNIIGQINGAGTPSIFETGTHRKEGMSWNTEGDEPNAFNFNTTV